MASPVVEVFIAFVLACSSGEKGPGTGYCKVNPPDQLVSSTKTLCQADVDSLKQAYALHPELAEFSKIGGRLYFGCYKTNTAAGVPDIKDVIKEIRK